MNNDYLRRMQLEMLCRKIIEIYLEAEEPKRHRPLIHYWHIGRIILDLHQHLGFSRYHNEIMAIIHNMGYEQRKAFNRRLLTNCRLFALAYPDFPQYPIASTTTGSAISHIQWDIRWPSLCVLLREVDDPIARDFYLIKTVEQNWNTATLRHWVETDLYTRLGLALSNFEHTLPPETASFTLQQFHDPYCFTTPLAVAASIELQVEDILMGRLAGSLRELGPGFTFKSRQLEIRKGNKTFRLDLLFFHTILRQYIIVEIKNGPFRPEYIGQLVNYQSLLDEKTKDEGYGPCIGLLLCLDKDEKIVTTNLRQIKCPMVVASYEIWGPAPA